MSEYCVTSRFNQSLGGSGGGGSFSGPTFVQVRNLSEASHDRRHAYILPNNTVWALNWAGTNFVQLNGGGGTPIQPIPPGDAGGSSQFIDASQVVGSPGTLNPQLLDGQLNAQFAFTPSTGPAPLNAIPPLPASRITSGQFTSARYALNSIPPGAIQNTTASSIPVSALPVLTPDRIPNLPASIINSGTFDANRYNPIDLQRRIVQQRASNLAWNWNTTADLLVDHDPRISFLRRPINDADNPMQNGPFPAFSFMLMDVPARAQQDSFGRFQMVFSDTAGTGSQNGLWIRRRWRTANDSSAQNSQWTQIIRFEGTGANSRFGLNANALIGDIPSTALPSNIDVGNSTFRIAQGGDQERLLLSNASSQLLAPQGTLNGGFRVWLNNIGINLDRPNRGTGNGSNSRSAFRIVEDAMLMRFPTGPNNSDMFNNVFLHDREQFRIRTMHGTQNNAQAANNQTVNRIHVTSENVLLAGRDGNNQGGHLTLVGGNTTNRGLQTNLMVNRTSTATTNSVRISSATGTGWFERMTSSQRYKLNIQDVSKKVCEKILSVSPVTWDDKAEVAEKKPNRKRYGGLIAEDVHDAGLTDYVEYNDKGEPEAVSYQTLWTLLIPVIKEQNMRIKELESIVYSNN